MPASVLLEKLIDIERSIGTEPEAAVRSKLTEVQDYLLQIENARARAYHAALKPVGFRKLCSHIYSRH
jgi:hypothetical protein